MSLLTLRISLQTQAIHSSFKEFPLVFLIKSVIEPAPQNSITSYKNNNVNQQIIIMGMQKITLNQDKQTFFKVENSVFYCYLIFRHMHLRTQSWSSIPGGFFLTNAPQQVAMFLWWLYFFNMLISALISSSSS